MFNGFSIHEHTIVDTKNLSFKEALSLEKNFQFRIWRSLRRPRVFFAVHDQVMKGFKFFIALEANRLRHQVSQPLLLFIYDASHQETINNVFLEG